MKKTFRTLLLVLVAAAGLSSCKEDEQNFDVGPKTQIVFDDNIEKVSGDFSRSGNITMKVTVPAEVTTLRLASIYNIVVNRVSVRREVDLGTVPVTGGVAMVSVPAARVRAAVDGPIPGIGPAVPAVVANPTANPPVLGSPAIAASDRVDNTYQLAVDAISPNTTERRFFTVGTLR